MSTAAFLLAGLVAFCLSFWLTRRRRQPIARSHQTQSRLWAETRSPQNRPALLLPLPLSRRRGTDLDRQVRDLLGQGKLIDAVTCVRETNGCSLGDAKAYVN
ncbi:MAG: hypothetical protein WBA99_03780, partial [Nodosilinea sp.]